VRLWTGVEVGDCVVLRMAIGMGEALSKLVYCVDVRDVKYYMQ
jgi:hypothetical protein